MVELKVEVVEERIPGTQIFYTWWGITNKGTGELLAGGWEPTYERARRRADRMYRVLADIFSN